MVAGCFWHPRFVLSCGGNSPAMMFVIASLISLRVRVLFHDAYLPSNLSTTFKCKTKPSHKPEQRTPCSCLFHCSPQVQWFSQLWSHKVPNNVRRARFFDDWSRLLLEGGVDVGSLQWDCFTSKERLYALRSCTRMSQI